MFTYRIGRGTYGMHRASKSECEIFLHTSAHIPGETPVAGSWSEWISDTINEFDPEHKSEYSGQIMTFAKGACFVDALSSRRGGRLLCMPRTGSYKSRYQHHDAAITYLVNRGVDVRENHMLASDKVFSDKYALTKQESRMFSSHMFYLLFKLGDKTLLVTSTFKGLGHHEGEKVDTTIIARDIDTIGEDAYFEGVWNWCAIHNQPSGVKSDEQLLFDSMRYRHLATPVWKNSDIIVNNHWKSYIAKNLIAATTNQFAIAQNKLADPAMFLTHSLAKVKGKLYIQNCNRMSAMPNRINNNWPIRKAPVHTKLLITENQVHQFSCNFGQRQMIYNIKNDTAYGESYRMDTITSPEASQYLCDFLESLSQKY